MNSDRSRSVTVKALEAKPPGTPYLDANSSGPAVASRPGEAMRVASFVAEMSKRATSNAPVFDGGTVSEGAWASPQKEGVPSLRMKSSKNEGGAGGDKLDRSQAFAYERTGTADKAFLAPLKGVVQKHRAGATKEGTMATIGSFAANLRHKQQETRKSMCIERKVPLIPNLGLDLGKLDANSKFLIAQLLELGVTDGAAIREMLTIDERKGLTTPRWALDNIHSAIEIFAHGFHNLVEELVKHALTHSKGEKIEKLDLSNEGPETFGEQEPKHEMNEAEVEEYGATLLLKSWALLLGYAENLTLSSEQLLKGSKEEGLEEDDDETERQKKSHSLSSTTGPLARVALQLDRQNKQMSDELSRSKMQFQTSEATRLPLVQALKEAKEKIEYYGKENELLVVDCTRARNEKYEALEIAEETHSESTGLRKEITKLAKLPVKVSELTRRVAANDTITRNSTVSLENLTKKHEVLKEQHRTLYGEYNEIEEALMRSRAAQASAEKKLNHALDAKALAVEERIRAEQRAHLASTERNTAENLYTMAENSLITVREKLTALEQSDKEKSIQIRTLEEQVTHTSAMAREYETSYKSYKEELETCKVERDHMKRELSFLNRSSTERNVELAKIERGFKNQIIEAKAEAEAHFERCEKALQDSATAKMNLEKLEKENERKEASWKRIHLKLSRNLQEAQESLKVYQKNSKDLLAERIEKWRIKEEEFMESLKSLQNNLQETKASERSLQEGLAETEERLRITEEEYTMQLEREMTGRSKAENELEDLSLRFQDQMARTAELAKEFKEFRLQYEKTSKALEETTKQKEELLNANQNLQTHKERLEEELDIETEAHLESRDQLEGEVWEVRENLELANKLMADAETALLQLSLGVELQSICPAGVTPVAYSQRMVEQLRTPIDTPPSRHGSIDEVRARAASRRSTSRQSERSEPQIMVINQDQNESDLSLPPIAPSGRFSSDSVRKFIGRKGGSPNPASRNVSPTRMRPATSQPLSSERNTETARPRPRSTESLGSVMKATLLDNLSQRITKASQEAGKPLSELKSEKARIQIQNMLKHKTSLFKNKLKQVDPEDYKTIDVQDMRWVEAMHQKGMSVLEFQLAKDGHYYAEIPDEAGFWRFTADRKMHVSGIKVGFPGLVVPPLAPNTYDETFGQQQQPGRKRQDTTKMSSELKSTKVDDWLKTHTPLRTNLDVTKATVGFG